MHCRDLQLLSMTSTIIALVYDPIRFENHCIKRMSIETCFRHCQNDFSLVISQILTQILGEMTKQSAKRELQCQKMKDLIYETSCTSKGGSNPTTLCSFGGVKKCMLVVILNAQI